MLREEIEQILDTYADAVRERWSAEIDAANCGTEADRRAVLRKREEQDKAKRFAVRAIFGMIEARRK